MEPCRSSHHGDRAEDQDPFAGADKVPAIGARFRFDADQSDRHRYQTLSIYKGFEMNSADLIEKIAAANDLTKANAKKLVDGILDAIADAAAAGDEISLNGFGKFKVKTSAAREGRNPSTGAAIQIAASKKLGFTAAKALKDKINA